MLNVWFQIQVHFKWKRLYIIDNEHFSFFIQNNKYEIQQKRNINQYSNEIKIIILFQGEKMSYKTGFSKFSDDFILKSIVVYSFDVFRRKH